ncbi:MAG: hypothetical protein KAJ19_26695, partial [Gammaproteobacteria bacterium]|nr:hypothetical protein [Gammaproteobacteria bacterium]
WDIKQNGLQDPILITEDNFVMEGNTRLCAFRHLLYQSRDNGDNEGIEKWRHIQCEMYPPGQDKLGMHYMLGTWHIKQKKPWDAFEKASYIKRLMNKFNKTTDEICDELKIKKAELDAMIWSYDVMIEEDVSKIKQYSHVEQIYQKPNLREVFDEKPDERKKIIKIIKDGNMGRAENIRKLPKIMEKLDNGLDLLEKGVEFDKVYSKALEEKPDDNPIFKDMVKISSKIQKLNTVNFIDEIGDDNGKIEIVNTFIHNAGILKKLCDDNILN